MNYTTATHVEQVQRQPHEVERPLRTRTNWPINSADEDVLLAGRPHLVRAAGEPGTLADELAKIARHIDREPEPLPERMRRRVLADIRAHPERYREALGIGAEQTAQPATAPPSSGRTRTLAPIRVGGDA